MFLFDGRSTSFSISVCQNKWVFDTCALCPLLSVQGGAADGRGQAGAEEIPLVDVFQPTLVFCTHGLMSLHIKTSPPWY